MAKFTIFWEMRTNERSYDDKRRCCFWTYELNAEWKIKCVCQPNKQRNLSFIELHRKSSAGECIASGFLEIQDEQKKQCLLKKKFICLLEDRSSSVKIDLRYPDESVQISPKIGELKISVTGEIKIRSTESSLQWDELVQMTDSDCLSWKQLSKDMEKLLTDQSIVADVILKCESICIPAHKNVLSARSPVFKAMFSCPLKESMENKVVIKNIAAPVLKSMLKYIYTGVTEDLTLGLACDLLLAANMYQIECLEATLANYLMLKMSMKNVVSILLLGDFVSQHMKNLAINFLCNNCTDYSALEKTNDWITLKNVKPALALEIFSNVVRSQEQKLKMLA